MSAIDPQVFAQHTDAKLRVWFSDGVNGFQQLTPDRPFASVPYAFSAGNAETANSAPIANGAVTKSMLSSEVINELDRKITMDDLDPTVIADLNDSVVDGSIGPGKLSSEVNNALKPVVLSQPNSVVSANGGSAYLSVDATGGNNSYKWKKNGVDIVWATSSTLSITDLNASLHEGNYTVVVSNAFGSVTSSAAQIDVNGSLTDGLVGWWKFDEIDGSIAYDSSGNGNDGNLTNGPNWVEGKIGGSLSFDGVDDYVQIPKVQSFFSNAASFTSWVKVMSYNLSNEQGLAVFGVGQNLHYPYSGNSQLYINILRSINRVPNIQTTVNFSDWHHVSITTQNNGYWVMYHNSSQISRVDAEPLSLPNNKSFGRSVSDSSFRYLNGLLDDVRIYDRALSAVEVKALYELGEQPVQESGAGTTSVVNGTVADGSITTNQLSEQILKYLKPKITQQPTAGNVFPDSDYTFSISAEGKYLTYQWKKNGVNLSGETNATLTITDANATQHDGNYSVVVSNDFGSVESGEVEVVIRELSPLAFSGVELWLDASDAGTLFSDTAMTSATTGSVAAWADKSGNNFNLAQSTASKQPSYDALNRKVSFNTQYLTATPPTMSQPITSFIVLEFFGSNTDSQYVHDSTVGRFLLGESGSTGFGLYSTQGGESAYWLQSSSFSPVNKAVMSYSHNGAMSYLYHNGILILNGTVGSDAPAGRFSVGVSQNLSGAFFNGSIYEFVIYSGSLSTNTRQILEGYLSHKHSLDSELPNDHPYKNAAP
jgi:hypothetical protein